VARISFVVRLTVAALVIRPAVAVDLLGPRTLQHVLVEAGLLPLIPAGVAIQRLVTQPEYEVTLVVRSHLHLKFGHLSSAQLRHWTDDIQEA